MNGPGELLAPAGDFDTARAAFAAGADAVYCGLSDYSARAFAQNLSFEELAELIAYAKKNGGRSVYVTFNTVLDEEKIEDAIGTLARLEEIGPDGLIVQDLGVARLCRRYFPGLRLHASTQLVAHNLEGVLALGELGFTRVVLARELPLAEIASIAKRCRGIELEVFIHGALCYSLSGLCLFGAMEKGRSGNRGRCPYCCRQDFSADPKTPLYPFSMKDLRLGEDARKLVDAGVASLKIEGRMKSPLYVASVVKYYRQLLDGATAARDRVTEADLETVFSRKTTELYFNGPGAESPVDPEFLGHRGTPIGKVKKVTRDRDGLAWLRLHTFRALERHDGLQFDALTSEGRRFGFGISEMRQAISRRNVFGVPAGEDVEILLPETSADSNISLRPGSTVYCSMSNAVKRAFPVPSFRPSDYPGTIGIDLEVALEPKRIRAKALNGVFRELEVGIPCELSAAKSPERTRDAVEKAFSKLGGTAYRLGGITLSDPGKLFAPASVLNDLRRDLVEALDSRLASVRAAKIEAATSDAVDFRGGSPSVLRTLKLRADQTPPPGDWDELVVAINADTEQSDIQTFEHSNIALRLALPVYTAERDFNRLRNTVKRFIREGRTKWECSDLATLRMLKSLGVTDLTADWTLYAFNYSALAQLAELGVGRVTASPENGRDNLVALAESGFPVECLVQQSTPLFISLTEPAAEAKGLSVFRRDGLFVTVRPVPRTFEAPSGAIERTDLSWDPA